MPEKWTPRAVHELAWGFQKACVVTAAAELDIFSIIAGGHHHPDEVSKKLGADQRATTVLLDALAAIGLLTKSNGSYRLKEEVAEVLTPEGRQSMFSMVRHLGRCLRRWAQLTSVVVKGGPAEQVPSILCPDEELAAFIEAMHEISAPMADGLVAELGPPSFTHLLDIGGGSGTWTLAFLRAVPGASATLFDLPEVVRFARRRLADAGMTDRATVVAGDYLAEPLPQGADLVWLSAILHQNSQDENRRLLAKVRDALAPGGRVLIRDVVMEPDRVRPPFGALFAVNMLVNTRGGGTYTFEEIAGWLTEAGFEEPRLVRRDEGMNSVVEARVAD